QEIQANDIDIRIDWAALAGGRLQFSRLDAGSVVRTSLGAPNAPPQPFTVTFEPLALPIGIRRSRLGRLTLISSNTRNELSAIDLKRALLDGRQLRLAQLALRAPEFELRLKQFRAHLAGDVPLQFALQWTSTDGAWRGRASARGSLQKLQFTHELDKPYAVNASGSVVLLGRVEPDFDVTFSWKVLPFERFSLRNGSVHLNGAIDDYAVAYQATAEAPELITGKLTGRASGNLGSWPNFDAHLASAAGNADVTGSVSWDGSFALDADVQLHDVDPAQIDARFEGKLGARAKLSMAGVEQAKLTVNSISGQLNSNRVEAHGELTVAEGALRCRQCTVSLGTNRLDVEGEASAAAIGLDVIVDAPALGSLWPGLAGSVRARGRLHGSPENPAFNGTLNARNLSYAGLRASRLDLQSQGAASDNRDIKLRISGLEQDGTMLGDLDLRTQGSLDNADIEGNWQRKDLSAGVAGHVTRAGSRFTGTVKRAHIHEPVSGDWKLEAAFDFQLDQDSFSASPQRWTGAGGELDLGHLLITRQKLRIAARLAAMPLQTFNAILPPAYRLHGTANADIDLTRERGQWSGSAHWRQRESTITVTPASGEPAEIQLAQAQADVEFKNGGAEAGVTLAIEPGVSAQATLRMQQLSPRSAVHAELHLSGAQWEWVPAVLPFIDRFEGKLDAGLSADGNLPSPALNGHLDWRGGRLFVPALNTGFDNINLTLTGAPDGAVDIKGGLDAGNGKLTVSGRIEQLLQPQRTVSLTLTGGDAYLLNWPEYRLWASPDLTIRGDASGWTLAGRMLVPRAEVRVRKLPEQATRPSADVVVRGQAPEPEPTQPYSGEIDLTLGDAVRVEAFGLDSGVTGQLQLEIPASGPLTAQGRLTLVDGVFNALKQKLTIKRGTLTFTGPLDNPLVDVRAERVIDTATGPVTAGLQLSGRAQNISSTVYSDPAMSEADALSYLTLGRPLRLATNSEGNEMANAAIALGLGQAGKITSQIGHDLGLDELTVAGDGSNGTALMAGKHLNRNLYARYTYGVFSRIGTLLLRYKLSKHLTLEAGAGEAQTFDLLYSIEKD
ncbi:MAG: translocation/assembly module TamB domain-containing protein, partial [Lysobacterales bacterium]